MPENQQKFYLGFELWEILTAFTLAFTLASGLLWFSNLQPKQAQNDYLLLEKTKNKAYNLSLNIDRFTKNLTTFAKTDTTATCLDNLKKPLIDYDLVAKADKELSELDYINSEISNDSKRNWILQQPDPSFTNMLSRLESSTSFAHKHKDKELDFNKQIVSINENILLLCADSESEIDYSEIEKLEKNLVTNSFESVSEAVKATNNIKEILIKVKNKEVKFESVKKELGANLFVVNNLDLIKLESVKDLDKTKKEFVAAVKDFEKWQQDYLQKNPDLKDKTIFINL